MPASIRVKLDADGGHGSEARGARLGLVGFGAPPSKTEPGSPKPAELVFHAGFLTEVRGAAEPEPVEVARCSGQLVLESADLRPVFVFDGEPWLTHAQDEDPEQAPYRQLALRWDSASFRAPPPEDLRLRLPPPPEGARYVELSAALSVEGSDEAAVETSDRLDLPLRPIGVVAVETELWKGRMPYLEDPRMFRVGLSAIFGDAIPAAAIEALRQDLLTERFVPPRFVTVRELEDDVHGYYHEGTVHLDEALVLSAKDVPEDRWTLFLVMVEEFGHYLDDQLRRRYSTVGGDAHGDEGSMFAADFIHYNKLVDSDLAFGTFELDDGFEHGVHEYRLDPAHPDLKTKAKQLLYVEDQLADQGEVTLPSGQKVRVEFFKIRGGGAVHEDITKWAAILAGIDYGTSLDEGCAWPDVPCSDEDSVETCYYNTWRTLHDEGTLANRSHYGDLQYWHSMAPAGKHTNGEVVDLIVKQLRKWFQAALDQDEIFHVGKMLHTVQDSYSRSHVIRKESKSEELHTKKVVKFQAYDAQDAHKHGEADKIQKGGIWKIPGALDARKASVEILKMYKRKATLDELETFLRETVYPFAPGAKDAEAGGSHQDYRPDWD